MISQAIGELDLIDEGTWILIIAAAAGRRNLYLEIMILVTPFITHLVLLPDIPRITRRSANFPTVIIRQTGCQAFESFA